jgi:hypothetical protein
VGLAEWHLWWKREGAAELNELLLSEWDPIGVGDVPEARNEYSSYAGSLARLLREGADVEALQAELSSALDHMGLEPSGEREGRVAERIASWYADSMMQHGLV